jgi:hypothetical protein
MKPNLLMGLEIYCCKDMLDQLRFKVQGTNQGRLMDCSYLNSKNTKLYDINFVKNHHFILYLVVSYRYILDIRIEYLLKNVYEYRVFILELGIL